MIHNVMCLHILFSSIPYIYNYCCIIFLYRSMHDLKRQVEAETENTLSRLTAVETEKQSVAMRVVDYQAENSQLKGEIQAMLKAQK